ncbi:L-lactate dehydrogenase (cytochrome) [Galbibacter marinus]|uniref:L-lactate dehydrogenase (Cytochrome) n=1 Tax=Galbibacter marinus TaxID=555500 RepID=K2P3Y5_9FLAO|nr:alpha-hydroxy acid oxidase [Galbibacter marinus]EKF55748.1 L-lactate dehydrogenase (cytochrome) [Galbibacter marinus]
MKEIKFDGRYPSVDDLRNHAIKKIPKFAFEYLDGGCNNDVNLIKNTKEIRDVELIPSYLDQHLGSDMKTELFGHTYDAPFGIAPVGLQGLMWPNAPEILAKSAFEHNIPFILSTVTTSSIEKIGEITQGKAWFQLYYPAKEEVRQDILDRAWAAGYRVLVILCDVPTFGFRPRDIRNGLAMPPKMSLSNIIQILKRPEWAIKTLKYGQPNFQTLKPYMPKNLDLAQLGKFMDDTFSGRLTQERIKPIREKWKGKLVLKGVANEKDAKSAIALGLDGLIVSNHGGRQLDAGESTLMPMKRIAQLYGDQIKVMMDSGLREGPDIARCMASGSQFTFLGRSFMYGVAALGEKGGDHTISLLKVQLQQIMDQCGCAKTADLKNHLKL